MNRRKFIETSGAVAGAAVLGSVKTTFNKTQPGSEPPQGKKSKIKLGLYSISYGGIWYEGPALSFEEFCKTIFQVRSLNTGNASFLWYAKLPGLQRIWEQKL